MVILSIFLIIIGVLMLFNYRAVDKYKPFYLFGGFFLIGIGICCIIQPLLKTVPEKKEDANLVISNIYVYNEDNKSKCNFKLENQDDKTWYYIKVRVDFKDSNNNIITSEEKIIVGGEGLALFKFYTVDTKLDNSITSASVSILDYREKK